MSNALIHITNFTAPIDLGSMKFRGVLINGNPWVVAPDACRVLGWPVGTAEHGGVTKHLTGLSPDEKMTVHRTEEVFLPLFEGTRASSLTLISESGLWKLIIRAHPDRNPAVRQVQEWLTCEVLPALRKDGMYVLGEEKVRTGEMSMEEMTYLVLTNLQNKVERITAERDQFHVERDQFANENVQLTARNTVLEHMREFVTVDAYLAEEGLIDGKYKSWQERKNIGIRAAAIARRRGIPLKKQDRWIRKPWGPLYAPVNILPREILAEACAEFGYIKLVVLAA
jgi:prophage antirepressor-like protein